MTPALVTGLLIALILSRRALRRASRLIDNALYDFPTDRSPRP